MKFIYLLLTIILLTVISYSQKSNDDNYSAERLCIKASEKIISNFEKELDSTLTTIMKYNSIVEAVEHFSFDAQMVSARYEYNSYYSLKRVTDKNRNELNIAQSYEIDVMGEFFYPTNYNSNEISVWSHWGADFNFYYYKAINIESSCLVCHGTKDDIPPNVRKKIKEIYSKDKAVGYYNGDLRGIYVVMIKWPEAKESLEQLLSKN
jgi:hypothetical protein